MNQFGLCNCAVLFDVLPWIPVSLHVLQFIHQLISVKSIAVSFVNNSQLLEYIILH